MKRRRRMSKEYTWRDKSRYNNFDAQVVGEELERIKNRDDGHLTAEAVVADAKRKKSPLHDLFDWDDASAAYQHRLEWARSIIRHVKIVVKSQKKEPKCVRAFVHLKENGGGYQGIVEVLSNEEKTHKLLHQALDEAIAWKKRYEELQELAPVFASITKVIEQVNREKEKLEKAS
jgi:predicted house-cleaning noncanonical NTP pyrophosphatase (MazG superfamily)